MKKSPLFLGMCALGVMLLAYTLYRSANLSLTHDEASTFLNYDDWTFWHCLYNTDCWKAANNHILNTLGVSTFVSLFGDAEIWVRITNWFAHILYLGCGMLIILRTKPNLIIGFFGFVLLQFHPYLLEYFGVARGYGLAAAFVMASITSGWIYYQTKVFKWAAFCWLAALLAVLSNFTTLLFFASALLAWVIVWIWDRDFIPEEQRDRVWGVVALVVFSCASFTFVPITTLSNSGEFLWGVDSFWTSIHSITMSYLMGQSYTGSDFPTILSILLWVGVLTSMAVIIYRQIIRKNENIGETWLALLMAFLLLGNQANHILLDAQYPEGRKLLFFVPIISTLLYFGALKLFEAKPKITQIVCSLVGVFMIVHLFGSANLTKTRDWYYDAQTKQAYHALVEEVQSSGSPANVGVYWIFSPTMNYYYRTQNDQDQLTLDRQQTHAPEGDYDYFIAEFNQTGALEDQYEEFKNFGNLTIMKRKSTPDHD